MKTTIKILMGLLTGILLIFAISSCSKDERNEMNIVGKWQSTDVNEKEYEAGKLIYDETYACIEEYVAFNFKADGTGQLIRYDEGESDTFQITWVILGEKLMVTQKDQSSTITFDIVDLRSNSMTLSMTDEYTYSGVQRKSVETMNFKKI